MTAVLSKKIASALVTRAITTSSVEGSAAAASTTREAPAQPTTTFYARDLIVQPCPTAERIAKPGPEVDLKFGQFYTDHMIDINWSNNDGWHKPQLHKLKNLELHPGSKVLHYAIELFEGMKAYRCIDNKIRMFRPDMNMARMIRTAKRASLPTFDANEMIDCIRQMIQLDEEWVPASLTSSLYIRPTLIATDKTLGVGHPNEAKLFVVAGPVGAYFSTGFQPVSLLADSQFVRAFPGGVGAYKMGCNYAPTIGVGQEAAKRGCHQVVWLYGDNEEITEVGTMNMFVLWTNEQNELELVTPPLDKGLILPGVTRDSLLTLAREYNEFKVSERSITMADIKRALKEKRLHQAFGAGTACVVSPIGRIVHRVKETNSYEELIIPTMESKVKLMQRFYEHINDIQYGRVEKQGWTVEV